MLNDIIEKELKKVEKADLTHFDPEKNIYIIPKRTDIKIEEEGCYLIYIKDTFFKNESIKVNWNNNSLPSCKYLKIEINKVLGKMLKVNSVGFDNDKQEDISYFWSGWLSTDEIDVIKKL